MKQKTEESPRWKKFLLPIIIGSVAVNILLASALILYKENREPEPDQKHYPLLAKRIFLENPNDILLNFTDLRARLNEYIKNQSHPIGIFFEYLPTGTSIGINQNGQFITASLLKIPIAMAAYKQISNGKIERNQLLTIKENHIDPFFGEGHKRKIGSQISMEEALHDMIVLSDNTAKNAILEQLSFGSLIDIADSLDIPLSKDNLFDTITPKNYSSILRSLYFAAYLSYEDSEKLLKLLTETPFKDKLSAGVPDNIPIAHKIGVFEIDGKEDQNVFSDCGIVYIPNRAYILCVMTASDEKSAQQSMSAISKMIYDYIINKT